jgi:hypothetical protein
MLETRMGEMRSPPPSVNARYFERLAKKDWLKNLQTAYFTQRIALKHARAKSHFVRYFGSASRNTHVIEQVARMLLPSDVVDLAEAQLASRIEASMIATDKATTRAQALLQAEGITGLPEYLQSPLEVEAKCTSPKVTRYLELILKADRLLTYFEALRLAGAIETNAYDHQVTVAVRELVAVPRSAFHLAIGLRKRANPTPAGAPANATQRSKGARPKEDAAPDPAAPDSTEAVPAGPAAAEAAQTM